MNQINASKSISAPGSISLLPGAVPGSLTSSPTKHPLVPGSRASSEEVDLSDVKPVVADISKVTSKSSVAQQSKSMQFMNNFIKR